MAEVSVSFQAGDQVQQNNPVMTVLQMGVRGQTECEWYVNGSRQTGWFDTSSLHLVTTTAPVAVKTS